MDGEGKANQSGQGPVGSWKLEEGGAEALPRTQTNLGGEGRTISPSQPVGPFILSTQFMTWFVFGFLAERGSEESHGPTTLYVNKSILNTFFSLMHFFKGDF